VSPLLAALIADWMVGKLAGTWIVDWAFAASTESTTAAIAVKRTIRKRTGVGSCMKINLLVRSGIETCNVISDYISWRDSNCSVTGTEVLTAETFNLGLVLNIESDNRGTRAKAAVDLSRSRKSPQPALRADNKSRFIFSPDCFGAVNAVVVSRWSVGSPRLRVLSTGVRFTRSAETAFARTVFEFSASRSRKRFEREARIREITKSPTR